MAALPPWKDERPKEGSWEWRAEGGSCAVFASKQHEGKVLLISKKKKKKKIEKNSLEDEEAVKMLESEIWRQYSGFSPELSHIRRREWFSREVAAPILNRTSALAQLEVVSVRSLLLSVDRQVPNLLREAFENDDDGLLMTDALTHFGLCKDLGGFRHETISFEIKPKSAVMLSKHALILPEQSFKALHSRYKLQQYLKMAKGKVEAISAYEPAEFFDGNRTAKLRALEALFTCPQNNLSVYKNAVRVFPAARSSLEEELGLSSQEMLSLLVQALVQQQGTLDIIRSLQERDVHGIEGIYQLYRHLLGKELNLKGNEGCEYLQKLRNLQSMPRQLALESLKDYLISATFKDCSLVVTFIGEDEKNSDLFSRHMQQQQQKTSSLPTNAGIVSGITRAKFLYFLQVIDTDLKPASKIPVHYDLDQQIVSHASNYL